MNRYSAQIIGWDDEQRDEDWLEIVELSNGKFVVLDLRELEPC